MPRPSPTSLPSPGQFSHPTRNPAAQTLRRIALGLCVWALGTSLCQAHRLSDACVHLTRHQDHWSARVDIPLRDLDLLVPLDTNGDGAVTWGELRAQSVPIAECVRSNLTVNLGDKPLALLDPVLKVSDIAGEPAASMAFTLPIQTATDAPSASHCTIRYALLFQADPSHRGLLRLESGGHVQTAVLSPEQPQISLEIQQDARPGLPPASAWKPFIREGVHHIWIGIDHILFLLALLLPSVLQRRGSGTGKVEEAAGFRPVLIQVLKVVTAFTVAHSITLILATLRIVELPSRLVETVIAASVAVAALNNLVPFLRERNASWMAFGFGLIHGFGFAGVLQELELPTSALVPSLLAFNVGVELGQLAIVAAFLPVAYALRASWVYRNLGLRLGSVGILLVATAWVAERAFDLRMPGI